MIAVVLANTSASIDMLDKAIGYLEIGDPARAALSTARTKAEEARVALYARMGAL